MGLPAPNRGVVGVAWAFAAAAVAWAATLARPTDQAKPRPHTELPPAPGSVGGGRTLAISAFDAPIWPAASTGPSPTPPAVETAKVEPPPRPPVQFLGIAAGPKGSRRAIVYHETDDRILFASPGDAWGAWSVLNVDAASLELDDGTRRVLLMLDGGTP